MNKEEMNELDLLLDQDLSNLTDFGMETLERLKAAQKKIEGEE